MDGHAAMEMSVVPWTGQPFRQNGDVFGTCARLQNMEGRETRRLLEANIASDLAMFPEIVEIAALFGQQPDPARGHRARGGSIRLIPHRRQRPGSGPRESDHFQQPKSLPRDQARRNAQSPQIWRALRTRPVLSGPATM